MDIVECVGCNIEQCFNYPSESNRYTSFTIIRFCNLVWTMSFLRWNMTIMYICKFVAKIMVSNIECFFKLDHSFEQAAHYVVPAELHPKSMAKGTKQNIPKYKSAEHRSDSDFPWCIDWSSNIHSVSPSITWFECSRLLCGATSKIKCFVSYH